MVGYVAVFLYWGGCGRIWVDSYLLVTVCLIVVLLISNGYGLEGYGAVDRY